MSMPENRKILLLGAGGHCKSVLDSLITLSQFDSIGIIDKKKKQPRIEGENDDLMGIPTVGEDQDLARLFSEGYTYAFITVGSIGDVSLRRKLYLSIKKIGFQIPNIIDKSSILSPFTTLGEGIYIGKHAVVNTHTHIGNCAIINTSAVIEHECRIGDFVHIASGSILCGKVQIDAGAHIGAGSVIKQGNHIGADTIIGMGSVVLKDIGSGVTAYGNPCKEVEHE